jgi:hypothetical protein
MKRFSTALIFGILLSTIQPLGAMAATTDIACSLGGKFTVTDNVVVSRSGLTCAGDAPIPSGTTDIDNFAFYNDSTNTGAPVTSVNFPSSLKTIGWGAFIKSRLVNISIPSTVTLVQNQAFQGVATLRTVDIAGGVGGETTELGYYLFNESAVESVTLGSGAFNYSIFTFSNARSLTSLVLPSWPSIIPEGFFKDSSSLTAITIPDSVTTIGVDAFRGMTSLTTVVIGTGVSSISATAFIDSGITSVVYCGSATAVKTYVFPNSVRSTCPSDVVAKTGEQLAEEARAANQVLIRQAQSRLFAILSNAELVTVKLLDESDCRGSTDLNISLINGEISNLKDSERVQFGNICRIVFKYALIDRIASRKVFYFYELVYVRLASSQSTSKAMIRRALRSAASEEIDSQTKILEVVEKVEQAQLDRKARLAAVLTRPKV